MRPLLQALVGQDAVDIDSLLAEVLGQEGWEVKEHDLTAQALE